MFLSLKMLKTVTCIKICDFFYRDKYILKIIYLTNSKKVLHYKRKYFDKHLNFNIIFETATVVCRWMD